MYVRFTKGTILNSRNYIYEVHKGQYGKCLLEDGELYFEDVFPKFGQIKFKLPNKNRILFRNTKELNLYMATEKTIIQEVIDASKLIIICQKNKNFSWEAFNLTRVNLVEVKQREIAPIETFDNSWADFSFDGDFQNTVCAPQQFLLNTTYNASFVKDYASMMRKPIAELTELVGEQDTHIHLENFPNVELDDDDFAIEQFGKALLQTKKVERALLTLMSP